MIVKLKNDKGICLVNSDHVLVVSGIEEKQGGMPIIGKCAVIIQGAAPMIVNHTIEEVYGLLRRGEMHIAPGGVTVTQIREEKPSSLITG